MKGYALIDERFLLLFAIIAIASPFICLFLDEIEGWWRKRKESKR